MSIRLMTKAWETECQSHTQKLVLLALADNANDQGVCWPSIPTIARKCSLTERAVYTQIETLQTMKLVGVDSGGGLKNNTYHIFPGFAANGTNGEIVITPERRSPPPLNSIHPSPERRSPLPLNTVQGSNITVIETTIQPGAVGGVSPVIAALRVTLCGMFSRPQSAAWTYEEERLLVDVAAREGVGEELNFIRQWRAKAERPPESILSLLSKWPHFLDRARNGKPRKKYSPNI